MSLINRPTIGTLAKPSQNFRSILASFGVSRRNIAQMEKAIIAVRYSPLSGIQRTFNADGGDLQPDESSVGVGATPLAILGFDGINLKLQRMFALAQPTLVRYFEHKIGPPAVFLVVQNLFIQK